MTNWGTQSQAYFIDWWLHDPVLVELKAVERPGISTEDVTFSFRAAPHSTFLESTPTWWCHLKWNHLLSKEARYGKASLGQHKTRDFGRLIIRLMSSWRKHGCSVVPRCQRSSESRSTHKVARLAEVAGLRGVRVSAFPECFTWLGNTDALLFHDLCTWTLYIFCPVHFNFCVDLCAWVRLFESFEQMPNSIGCF